MSKKTGPQELSKYACEFLGTFMLVFTVGLTLTCGTLPSGAALKVFGPTAIACVLMVMIYSFGKVSGGHLNPAVTAAVFLQKEIPFMDALVYMACQCAGGAAAGLATGFLYGFEQTSSGESLLGPRNAQFSLGALIVEMLYTFLLCFVVLNTVLSKEIGGSNQFYGLAIGFVVIAGAYGGGYVSGGAFNPAVALGINFMGVSWKTLYLPMYVGVQFLGSFLAVWFFHTVRPSSRTEFEGAQAAWLNQKFSAFQGMFDPEDTSEFLGAFFLCFTISLNAMATQDSEHNGGAGNPGAVWSIAACLMCCIFSMGDISGGLFNPSLTLAFLIRWYGTGKGFNKEEEIVKDGYTKLCDPDKKMSEGPKYLIAQCLGGAAGSGMTLAVWLASGSWPGAAVQPQGNFTLGQAFFAETFGTFLLCYGVLCMGSVAEPVKEYLAFAIGGCIIAAGYAFGPLSGGILNPAVTIANSVCYKISVLYTPAPLAYLLAQLLGGALAALIFKFVTHPHEYDSADGKELNEPLVGTGATETTETTEPAQVNAEAGGSGGV